MKGGRGRGAIVNWRVKCGKKDVFSDYVKMNCRIFIKENQKNFKQKLKLVAPNY